MFDMNPEFVFGAEELSPAMLVAIAQRKASVRLSDDGVVISKITDSAKHVSDLLDNGGHIYGVTTGYGDSVVTEIPRNLVPDLPIHLTRYHGCGTGRFLTPEETRAALAVRLVTLARGWSGVSLELAELLADMIRLDILPLIPSEGSVGASGDLTPLSYIAGALAGERKVLHKGEVKLAREAFAEEGLKEITLKPKEGLAVMNGTSIMTALCGMALEQAKRLSTMASRLTSMTAIAILGNPHHFDARLFEGAKPHPGQARSAKIIREDLDALMHSSVVTRLQDRYSVRCAPHVIGVLEDAMPMLEQILTTEINSSNDNPLFDPETGDVLHGGHFYGGHACFVADSLKNTVANLADLMDRQVATLVDGRYNNGLPVNLSGAYDVDVAPINHGFKAIQIAVSAWTAEALKLTMPASVFSRSTECHNQDKVSMGTIAARDALRVNELVAQVTAAHMMASAQAIEIRMKKGEIDAEGVGAPVMNQIAEIRRFAPFITEDTPTDEILTNFTKAILTGEFEVTL